VRLLCRIREEWGGEMVGNGGKQEIDGKVEREREGSWR